jgi:carbonic anhydrase/acetyltransferase-like protein (isoleucine patch superfamily)
VFSRLIISSFFAACVIYIMNLSSEASPHRLSYGLSQTNLPRYALVKVETRGKVGRMESIRHGTNVTRGRVGRRESIGHGTNVTRGRVGRRESIGHGKNVTRCRVGRRESIGHGTNVTRGRVGRRESIGHGTNVTLKNPRDSER